jgi:hypothetical protein
VYLLPDGRGTSGTPQDTAANELATIDDSYGGATNLEGWPLGPDQQFVLEVAVFSNPTSKTRSDFAGMGPYAAAP